MHDDHSTYTSNTPNSSTITLTNFILCALKAGVSRRRLVCQSSSREPKTPVCSSPSTRVTRSPFWRCNKKHSLSSLHYSSFIVPQNRDYAHHRTFLTNCQLHMNQSYHTHACTHTHTHMRTHTRVQTHKFEHAHRCTHTHMCTIWTHSHRQIHTAHVRNTHIVSTCSSLTCKGMQTPAITIWCEVFHYVH